MNATQPNDGDHGFAPPHNSDLMTEDGPDGMFDDNSTDDDDGLAEIDIIEAEIARHEQSLADEHDAATSDHESDAVADDQHDMVDGADEDESDDTTSDAFGAADAIESYSDDDFERFDEIEDETDRADEAEAHDDAETFDDDTFGNEMFDDGDTFAALGLAPEILSALDRLGYEAPTPIQRETIPALIDGADVLGQAATGTGKTAAFALPILHRLGEEGDDRSSRMPSALILVPTRELALQVSEAIYQYGRDLGTRVVAVYGGQPIQRQFKELKRGVDVVVATPGRAVDHIGRGSLPLDQVETVVLDEADEMLDMGFADDLETILDQTPRSRQTVLFSATLPKRINKIAEKYQNDPVRITIQNDDAEDKAALIEQRAYVVQRKHKSAALIRLIDVEQPTATIVFCRTRGEVDSLTAALNARGYRADALHGGMDQKQRDRVMQRLRDTTSELLIATDVAARGIDVDSLTHVVNYDVPTDAEGYTHRIGRVGRAGRKGVAITLVEPKEQRHLSNIERRTGSPIHIAAVPTADELRSTRTDQLKESLTAAMDAEPDRAIDALLDDLATDHGLREIAAAALRLARDATSSNNGDEYDIPDARQRHDGRDDRRDRDNRRDRDRSDRPGRDRGPRGGSFEERARENDQPTGFVHVSIGRQAGVRPGDLVGAIANQVGLPGSQIGPIRIADHYSVVGVPESSVDTVISALSDETIRGKSTKVRRFVDHDGDGGGGREGGRSGGGGYRGGNRDGGYRGSRDGDDRRDDRPRGGGYQGRNKRPGGGGQGGRPKGKGYGGPSRGRR